MDQSQFRPRSPTEIVDAAMQLGRRHYQPLLVLSAIIAIPNLALGLATQWLLGPAVTAAGEFGDATDILLLFLMTVASMAWLVIGIGALVASTAEAYVEGRALEPLDAMGRALRRAWRLVASNLLAYFIVLVVLLLALLVVGVAAGIAAAALGAGAGGAAFDPGAAAVIGMVIGVATAVLMFVGGLLFGSRYVNITAAVMLEDLGIVSSMRRSARLVAGHLWRTAGVVLIMLVLYTVAFLTSWALFLAVVRDVNLSANVAGVLVLALYPFLGAMLTLLYFDLRIRREGYDLELMARALDAGAAPPADGSPGGIAPGGPEPAASLSA